MAPAVQQACGWLLTPGTEGPMPAAEAAGCVAEAMKAGGGALQTMETNASGLPAGSHTAEIRTSPGFALHFKNEEHRVEIVVVDGSSWLITPDGEVKADSAGSPEEKYAALLVEAAGLVSDPAAVSALITDSGDFRVEHGAERNGIAYTKISALSGPTVQGVKMGSFDIWLDDLYRPVHVELAGNENEILTTISATFEDWGRDTVIRPPA